MRGDYLVNISDISLSSQAISKVDWTRF